MRYACKAFLFIFSVAFAAAAAQSIHSYTPPHVLSVTNAYKPYLYLADGFFILGVNIDSRGTIFGIEKWRDPGSMMPVAIAAVHTWKFSPAIVGQDVTDSVLPVVFVYRPTTYIVNNAEPPSNFQELMKFPGNETVRKTDFLPPKIVAVAYPQYPANSVAGSSVIVQVVLSGSGEVQRVQVLRDSTPFTRFALDALESWRFEGAQLRGKPVISTVGIAFIFQPPPTTGD